MNWPVIMGDQRRLARAVGAEEDAQLVLLDAEVEVVEDGEARHPRGEALDFQKVRHPSLPLSRRPRVSDGFVHGRRAAGLPVELAVVRLLIGFFDDLMQRRSLLALAHPVADRADDAVAHHQDDEDEQAADDDLPPGGKHAAEKELGALDQEGADERPDDGAAAAHSRPDHALDREHGPGVEEGDDADPGGIERAGRRGHEGGDAEHEDTVVGDVVAHEFRAHVVVADRLEHCSDARMRQRPRSNEKHDDTARMNQRKRARRSSSSR